MINSSWEKANTYDFSETIQKSETNGFFEVSVILIAILINVNSFLMVIFDGFLIGSIQIADDAFDFVGISKGGIEYSIGAPIDENDVLAFGL
jgi:hypothetical protein